nr:phage integrase N-terminal SAM-like domain-containing protein [uncultured Draconibacterium sp.]
MNRKKIAILPKLYDANGNMKKKWFVYFSYKNPANDKMKRFRVFEGFATLYTKKDRYEHAENLIQEYTNRLNQGWNPFDEDLKGGVYEDSLTYATVARVYKSARASNKTFNYYSNQFLPEVEGMARKTYLNYVSKYRIFNTWLNREGLAGNDLRTITPEIVRAFFLFLINDEKLAKITVTKYKHMLERFFDWCVNNKHIKTSPMVDIPSTKRQNDTAPRPIHEADINKLVDTIKETDRQLWLSVQLEYYCFMRPVEIRLSRVSWFDLSRGVISVPAEVVKTTKNKTVIIPDVFREYLMNEWKLHLLPPDYFLIGQNGIPGIKPLGDNNLRNRFNIIRDRLRLPKEYKLYSFKHTGNARTADAGFSMYDRQRQNGHTSMKSTEEYLKNKIGFQSEDLQKHFPRLDKK